MSWAPQLPIVDILKHAQSRQLHISQPVCSEVKHLKFIINEELFLLVFAPVSGLPMN